MIGTILSNRYKLIAELGSGGMAWVYLAEDLVSRRKVAVKVLYPQHSQDVGFLQRFIREAKLSMALCQGSPQPNIVAVLDYGADRDTHYLVMDYVPGQDLGQHLAQEGSLPWQQALDIARQVAWALSHAYQLDIVHRDIKPSNIMIRPDGIVQVLDFGIARARTSPSLTLTGFVGSPHYAAPEQAMGRPVDIRADLYSLGVVLYRMLSGKPPFQGDTPWAIVNQHIVSEPAPLADSHPDLPPPVIQVVQKAMAKEPDERFQSPNDMVHAIDELLDRSGLPVGSLAASPAEATATLETLFKRAHEAAQAERWQEAVDLYSQILKIDPDYHDAAGQLDIVGRQITLANLYRSARRALHSSEWDQALAQLDKIAEMEPDYKDVEDLRLKAQRREKARDAGGPAPSEFPTQIPPLGATEAMSPTTLPASAPEPSVRPDLSSETTGHRRSPVWMAPVLLALILAAATSLFLLSRQEPAVAPVADSQLSPTWTARPGPTPTASPPLVLPSPSVAAPSPTLKPALPTPESTHTPTPTARPIIVQPTSMPSDTPSAEPTSTPTATLTPSPSPTVPIVRRPSMPLVGQIAFPRFDPARSTYDVYVCHVDGSNCRQVAAEASQPDFLPDGRQLVTHSWNKDAKGLILQTLSGQPIWRITDQIEAARPSVDSRGEGYVYHSRHETDRQPRLYRTFGVDIRPIRREASDVVGQSPSWLPDQRVLYSGCWLDNCGILVMQADGTFPRQVAAGAAETNPEASPDGQQVAFMSRRDGNWEVYVVNLDGTGLRRLTHHPANDGLPTWSPEGRYIAFVTDRDGPWAVWVMRPDGSGQRRLFDLGGPLDGQVQNAASYEIHGWVEERISWSP